jgi:hypothetical protein
MSRSRSSWRIDRILNDTSIDDIKLPASHLIHGAATMLPQAFVDADFDSSAASSSGEEQQPEARVPQSG